MLVSRMKACIAPAVVIFALALLSTLTACGSTQKRGTVESALAAYDARQYQDAHDQAVNAIDRTKGAQRDQASYIAGLSAYQLGDRTEAETHLSQSATSSDPQTAGRSKAMLGTIRMDQNRPRDAAPLFTEASHLLAGDEAKQAALQAAMAYERAGDSTAATQARTTAERKAAEPVSPGGFALQVGAFSDKSRARRAAREADDLSRKSGYGPARLINATDSRGKPLYIVQFGRFATRDQASAVRAKLGKLEYIVATAPPSSSSSSR